jgi:hypothetical protein
MTNKTKIPTTIEEIRALAIDGFVQRLDRVLTSPTRAERTRGHVSEGPATLPQRTPAARKAQSERMKAYWRKVKKTGER